MQKKIYPCKGFEKGSKIPNLFIALLIVSVIFIIATPIIYAQSNMVNKSPVRGWIYTMIWVVLIISLLMKPTKLIIDFERKQITGMRFLNLFPPTRLSFEHILKAELWPGSKNYVAIHTTNGRKDIMVADAANFVNDLNRAITAGKNED